MERSILAAICAMALLLVLRHRENISRLIAGKESRLGSKKAAAPGTAPAPKPPKAGHK